MRRSGCSLDRSCSVYLSDRPKNLRIAIGHPPLRTGVSAGLRELTDYEDFIGRVIRRGPDMRATYFPGGHISRHISPDRRDSPPSAHARVPRSGTLLASSLISVSARFWCRNRIISSTFVTHLPHENFPSSNGKGKSIFTFQQRL